MPLDPKTRLLTATMVMLLFGLVEGASAQRYFPQRQRQQQGSGWSTTPAPPGTPLPPNMQNQVSNQWDQGGAVTAPIGPGGRPLPPTQLGQGPNFWDPSGGQQPINNNPQFGTGRYQLGVQLASANVWMTGSNGQWVLTPGNQVVSVTPNSPAWGRLDPGDIILRVNGRNVGNPTQLTNLLQDASRTNGTVKLLLRNVRNGMIENHSIPLQAF